MRASFLPGPHTTVAERIDELKLHEIALGDGAVLETGCVYIVPLIESLALPDDIAAAANPKSSTGRLDVFTRVIADETRGFDRIEAGYHGPLYAEISPRTFPVLVREGSRLSQIRFRHGNALLDAEALRALHARERLVDDDDADLERRHRGERRSVGACSVPRRPRRLPRQAPYRPDRCRAPRRLRRRAISGSRSQRAQDQSLILDPDEFYILASKEAVQVPPDYAAEMVPFDPLVGEFRVHYAGFFDPGFGYAGAGGRGARAVLEVRSREVPFILEHGQIVGRLVYERMLARPSSLYGEGIGSNYQAQGLKLSKHFRDLIRGRSDRSRRSPLSICVNGASPGVYDQFTARLAHRPASSARSSATSARSLLTSARIGAASSWIISRSASRSAASAFIASACMALTTTPMNRLSTMKVVTTMKVKKNSQA